MRSGLIVCALMVTVLGSCAERDTEPAGSGSNDTAVATERSHPAMTAANRILTALRNNDSAAIKSMFNRKNRENIADEQLADLFRQANQMIGDATQATELRAGSGPNEVLARVRDMGSEVCLLVLTEEDGQYLWDDINSAAVDEFQSMALIE